MATQLEEMETLLGVAPDVVGSPLGLAQSIEAGLPVAAVDRIAEAVAPNDPSFKYRIVPKATLERRRKSKTGLKIEEGDRVARLGKVYSMAISVYHDRARAQEFLTRPHMMLENQSPLEVALTTGPGADAVVNLLGRAAYGGGV